MTHARTSEWIDRVPRGWCDVRLKDLFSYGKGLNITKADLVESGVPVVSYGQIHAKHNSGTHLDPSLLRFVPEELTAEHANSHLSKGDVVFADTSEDLTGIGNCVLNDSDETVYAGYHSLIAKARFPEHSKYLSYLFQTDAWRSQIRTRAFGIKVFSLTQRTLNGVTVMLPPRAEQGRIAAFLDAKCADVNKAIAAKRKQLECLDALWKSHLQTITTRGIGNDSVRSRVPRDRDAPDRSRGTHDRTVLLPTSNPRYPLVPVGWQIKRVKRICTMSSGEHLGSEDISPEGEFPVYGGNGLRGYFSRYNTEGIHILVGRQGALCGNVHLVDGRFWATEHALVVELRPNYDVEYIAFMFDAMNFNQYVSQSAAQPGLAASKILNVEAVLPPLEEQRVLAKVLKERRAHFDALAANLRKQIETLEQYRKSLIHECVTGARRCG